MFMAKNKIKKQRFFCSCFRFLISEMAHNGESKQISNVSHSCDFIMNLTKVCPPPKATNVSTSDFTGEENAQVQ